MNFPDRYIAMQRILTTGSCYWLNKVVNALVEGIYGCKGNVSCESRFPRPCSSHSSTVTSGGVAGRSIFRLPACFH